MELRDIRNGGGEMTLSHHHLRDVKSLDSHGICPVAGFRLQVSIGPVGGVQEHCLPGRVRLPFG